MSERWRRRRHVRREKRKERPSVHIGRLRGDQGSDNGQQRGQGGSGNAGTHDTADGNVC